MKRRAVVLCGPGNNGGDGFVVARLLHQRGWDVEVFLYGDAEKLPPDARVNYERWCKLGDVIYRMVDPPALVEDTLFLDDYELLVDGLFGIGLTRPIRGVVQAFTLPIVRDRLREIGVKVVAIDIPSGLSSDEGKVLNFAVHADLTVTFHRRKFGHVLGDGPEVCGKVVVKDIGL